MKNWKEKFKKMFPEGLGEEGNGCNDPDCCGGAGFVDRTDDVINFIEKLLKKP